METLTQYWPQIFMVFCIIVAIIEEYARRSKNKRLLAVSKQLDETLESIADKDAALLQTFKNVNDLKKILKDLIEDEKIDKIGELFKSLNENVGMEEVVKKELDKLLGDEH